MFFSCYICLRANALNFIFYYSFEYSIKDLKQNWEKIHANTNAPQKLLTYID